MFAANTFFSYPAIVLALCLPAAAAPAVEPDPLPIMERNFASSKVLDSVSNATFTLTNKSGQERVRKTFGTSKLQANGIDNMRMTRFTSPPDIKGTVTLMMEHAGRDDDIWIYLPALKKSRRLVASNKKDSFVGSDFAYADVIGYRVGEWNYTLLGEESVEGQPCYVIEAMPKTDTVLANTGYSKRIDRIRKDNAVTLRSDFWDESGRALKTALYGDVQLVDPKRGKWQAMRMEAKNLQTGHRTLIQFEHFKVNQQVKDEFFTVRYMENDG